MHNLPSIKVLKKLPREARNGEFVALDVETFGQPDNKIHRPTGQFAALSVAFGNENGVYILTDKADISRALQRLSGGTWVIQNALYDLVQLRRHASIPQRQIWDTMIVEQDLFGGWYNSFGLDALARRWLGVVLPKGLQSSFKDATELTPEQEEYACMDAWAAVNIALAQRAHILGHDLSMDWYFKIDAPAIWTFLDMPGLPVDLGKWEEIDRQFREDAERKQQEIGFNVKSPKAVPEKLTEAGFSNFKWWEGNASEDVLKRGIREAQKRGWTRLERLCTEIIGVRKNRTAIEKWGFHKAADLVEDDGKIYTSWKICGAETGRTSCSDPPLQQVPVREQPIWRTMFVPSPGNRMLVADVSQQEPRILAHLSKDKNLKAIFDAGLDLHTKTQEELKEYGVETDRRGAKDLNLGTSYGMSAIGLSRRTGMPYDEAEEFIDAYFRMRPGVKAWIRRTQKNAMRLSYVNTASGRPVWVNPYSWQAERNAINSPIQGSAADQLKMTMNLVHERTRRAGLPYAICHEMHDEILVDVPRGTMPEYRDIVEQAWIDSGEELFPDIPMKVDMASGFSWGVK